MLISAEPDTGVMVTQVCERILFQNLMSLSWNFVLPDQTKIKFSFFLFFFKLEEVETNVSYLKFIYFQTLIEECVHCSGQKS